MGFSPRDYFEAAVERHDQAEWLFGVKSEDCERLEEKRYALVIYLAGLAVESMFRAYRGLINSEFDGRHDLDKWFNACEMDTVFRKHSDKIGVAAETTRTRVLELKEAVEKVVKVWCNNHRYACERVLVGLLLVRRVIKPDENKGSKPEVLRKQARKLLRHTAVIVGMGREAWAN